MKHNNDIIFYPKYLSLLNSINFLCMLFPVILSIKLLILPIIGLVLASVLFIATYFVIFSIVAEVYGYKAAQKTMINGLIVPSIFTWIMQIIIHIHPDSQNMNSLEFDTSNASNLSNYYTQITSGTSIILCLTEFLTNIGTKAFNLLILTIPTLIIVNYLKKAENIAPEYKVTNYMHKKTGEIIC